MQIRFPYEHYRVIRRWKEDDGEGWVVVLRRVTSEGRMPKVLRITTPNEDDYAINQRLALSLLPHAVDTYLSIYDAFGREEESHDPDDTAQCDPE